MSIFYRRIENDLYHGDMLRQRNELKRNLLSLYDYSLQQMAELENMHLGTTQLRYTLRQIFRKSLLLIDNLNILTEGKYHALYRLHQHIESATYKCIQDLTSNQKILCVNLEELEICMDNLVGGKAVNLHMLASVLPQNILPGFVLTTSAYYLFLEENQLMPKIQRLLANLDVVADCDLFYTRTRSIRELIERSSIPEKILAEIQKQVANCCDGNCKRWVVRSSAVGEDSKKSFAGQFDSIVDVPLDALAKAYVKVIASRFSERAVYYRLSGGLREIDTPMAVLFLPLIYAGSAGVLYTRDPRDPSVEQVLINSVWGLAMDLLNGCAPSDTFVASRTENGRILRQQIRHKPFSQSVGAKKQREKISLSNEIADAPSLSKDKIAKLVKLGLIVEKFFSAPQEIEWAIDKEDKIWLVQTRNLQVKKRKQVFSKLDIGSSQIPVKEGITVFPDKLKNKRQIHSKKQHPLYESILQLNINDSENSPTVHQCRSLRDIIHFVYLKALDYDVLPKTGKYQ